MATDQPSPDAAPGGAPAIVGRARPRLLIYGAGGHAQVVADATRAAIAAGHLQLELVGFVDDAAQTIGTLVMGMRVWGPIAAAGDVAHELVVVGIGSNPTRRRFADDCLAQGRPLQTVIHPRATVAVGVDVGAGSVIFAGAVVNTGSTIGANVILNTRCSVDHHNHIGSHAHIGPGVTLGGDVSIGEGTLVGIGATVMPQRRVGAWSTVGAGSLVHRTVGDGQTVVGAPARVLR
jgi:sugar O-acyltransferase (sialic acid O-acetyltransferase NeuD family)